MAQPDDDRVDNDPNSEMKEVKKMLSDLRIDMDLYKEDLLAVILDHLNLRTYSLLEASRVSGIGYKKLYCASKSGELETFLDGRTTRVRHLDLRKFERAEIEKVRKMVRVQK